MKNILFVLGFLFCLTSLNAKQFVEYYRYNFNLNVAKSATTDLENLIKNGFKIVSFSLDYQQKCMVVVYEDNK